MHFNVFCGLDDEWEIRRFDNVPGMIDYIS